MRATLDHLEHQTPLCTTFWFNPDRRIHFNAGEFAEFYLPHPSPDNRGDKRWFTLCSSPHDPLVGITVKFADKNGSSFKAALRSLNPGDEIFIGEPFGDFVLPKDPRIPLIFAAVGIGITPMISIVRWIIQEEEHRDITLFHVVATPEDFLELELFREHTEYHPLVKTAHPQWQGQSGVLTAAMLMKAAIAKDRPFIYLAGPKQSVQDLAHGLHEHGFSRDQLAIDLFTGAIDLPKG
jgi:ferredoxin-NADP reductase